MSLSRAWIFVRNVFKNITVEPIVFLYVINACTYQIVFQNLQIEKACKVNLNHTADVCDNLKDPANEDVQNEVRNPEDSCPDPDQSNDDVQNEGGFLSF